MRVPDPEVPDGYSLTSARWVQREGNRSVSLTYERESVGLVVSKVRRSDRISEPGEPVLIGDATGRYRTLGAKAFVVWRCQNPNAKIGRAHV